MELKEKILGLVQDLLDSTFEGEKRKIKVHHDRLNFACPYCRDSEDQYKKRGNLYLSNLRYSCFNGGCEAKSIAFNRFLKDHGKKLNDVDIIEAIANAQKEFKPIKKEFSSLIELNSFAVPISDVESRYGLVPIETSVFATNYLKGRSIYPFRHMFRWNPAEQTIYILNLSADTTKIVAFQISKFKGPNKYISFNLDSIRSAVGLNPLPESKKENLNRLSLFFGILRTNFEKKVTLFEGFIDSLFIENSIALTGIKKNFDELSGLNFRFMFDNDKDGIAASIKLLKKRKPIFLWSKALKEYGLDPKIKDLNQMIINAKENQKEIKEIDRYFTKDPNDLIYL